MIRTLIIGAVIAIGTVIAVASVTATFAGDELPRTWRNPDHDSLPEAVPSAPAPDAGDDAGYHKQRDAGQVRVPAGHLPPPGRCRLWFSNRPAGHQPPPGNCDVLEGLISDGVFLVRGSG